MGMGLGRGLGPNLRKVPRLGKNCKIGDLKRLAEASINGGACGLIRQYSGNLTSWSHFFFNTDVYTPVETILCVGAAWLSSVRAVRRGIELPNEQNPLSVARPPPEFPPGLRSFRRCLKIRPPGDLSGGGSQVNMVYIVWATHVPQGLSQRAAMANAGATPQKQPRFGLRAATRAHEGETVSNRTSERYVESTPCFAHTAHHARKVFIAGSISHLPKPSSASGAANRAGGDLSEVDTR